MTLGNEQSLPFAPQNPLEAALIAASSDPGARPRFYQLLLESDLYIINEGPVPTTSGSRTLTAGTELRIRPLSIRDVDHVPVFSSLLRIRQVVDKEVQYLEIPGRALLEIIGHDHVIMNPGLEYGKILTPDEIHSLLDGSIFKPASTEVVAEDRNIMLGQPARMPTHLMDALESYFRTQPSVRAAYLAHYFDPQSGTPPHSLIGVEYDDGARQETIVGEASLVLRGVSREGDLVAFVQIDDSGVSRYMVEETKPFYRRKKLLKGRGPSA